MRITLRPYQDTATVLGFHPILWHVLIAGLDYHHSCVIFDFQLGVWHALTCASPNITVLAVLMVIKKIWC